MGHILFPTLPLGVFLDAMRNHPRFPLVYDHVHQFKRKAFQHTERFRAGLERLILHRAETLDPREQVRIA
jgi:hypothetical protein